jgi:hypothetical protein
MTAPEEKVNQFFDEPGNHGAPPTAGAFARTFWVRCPLFKLNCYCATQVLRFKPAKNSFAFARQRRAIRSLSASACVAGSYDGESMG